MHRNAEFQLTRALAGDPRVNDRDYDGTVVLVTVVRATRHIKAHEQVLVHYNPEAGVGSWAEKFKC